MKRPGFLFEQITDYANIRHAFLKALRGNRTSPAAISFCRNIDQNLAAVQSKLLLIHGIWGGYRSFQITEPKPRVISTAPFEQRIMHHAIMNVMESVFDRPMIHHSYACRKGKGTHAAVLYAFRQCRINSCFLKLDIRKYFDSIDHQTLKTYIRRFIKDARVIALLDGIIDSYEKTPGKGVPIGNLTSQFFANIYLAGLDHYVLEKLNSSAYCRYMDDFVVWGASMTELQKTLINIRKYVNENLCLTLKESVFGKTYYGLPFLGFLIKEKGIYLIKKTKRRVTKRIFEITSLLYKCGIDEAKAGQRSSSVFASIALARTNRLRKKLCERGERLLGPTG
jgi:hypothetical protein